MNKKYLESSKMVDWKTPIVQEQANKLIIGIQSNSERLSALFYFVRDEIKYEVVTKLFTVYDLTASTVLKKGVGFCVNKAVLLTALCRAIGLPSRLHFATIRNYTSPDSLKKIMGTDLFYYHGYSEVFLDNRWIKLTPAFDKQLLARKNLPVTEFDGQHDALLPSKTFTGEKYIEYVKDHGVHASVPIMRMGLVWAIKYGPATLKAKKNEK
jgi:transglutaminase-like putative cysteine protease